MKKEWIWRTALVVAAVLLWFWVMFGFVPRGEITNTVGVLITQTDVPADHGLLVRYLENQEGFKRVDFDRYLVDLPRMASRYWFAEPGPGDGATVAYLAESPGGEFFATTKRYSLSVGGFYRVIAAHLDNDQLIMRTATSVKAMVVVGVMLLVVEMVAVGVLWSRGKPKSAGG